MPIQKADAQRRKAMWPRRTIYLHITLWSVGLAFVYSVTVNLLSMFEGTMCLKIAGGEGCPASPAADAPPVDGGLSPPLQAVYSNATAALRHSVGGR